MEQLLYSKLENLTKLKDEFINSSKRLIEAGNKNIYSLDLFAGAVNNRAISLLQGFVSLAKENNYLSAIPLIRIQLDNGLRFFASTLVTDSDEFFSHFLNGKAIKDFHDTKGNKLSDNYLVSSLEKHFTGVRKLYKDTSGYIHLSDNHLFATTNISKEKKDRMIEIRIGNYDVYSLESKIDFTQTMIEVCKLVLIIVEQWKYEKENISRSPSP